MPLEYKPRSIEHILELTHRGNRRVPTDVFNKMFDCIGMIAAEPDKRDRLNVIVPKLIQRYERQGYFMDLFKRAYNLYEQIYFKEVDNNEQMVSKRYAKEPAQDR